jgi:hypothetical protein
MARFSKRAKARGKAGHQRAAAKIVQEIDLAI